MNPYAGVAYFAIALGLAVPALAFRQHPRWWRGWLLVSSVLMLAVHNAGQSNQVRFGVVPDLVVVLGYLAGQWLVARGFLAAKLRGRGRGALVAALALAIAPLLLVKVAPILAPESRVGFLGVSYLTFRCVDVLIAIEDKLVTSFGAGSWISYVFFFPTVASGPIDRYRRFAADLERVPAPGERWADADEGVGQIFTGLLYKFIIGSLVKQYALDPLEPLHGWWPTVGYMYAYSAYLFFDFAGYSAIAIGVGRLLGIRVPANFDRPFLAANIVDFWNRWHISLSTWFRDQIYMRFVLASTRRAWFRNRQTASAIGFLITFLVMGFWHGLAWRYVLYGLYHAILLGGYGYFAAWNRRRGLWKAGPAWRVASIVVTAHAVGFGFLLFSGRLI